MGAVTLLPVGGETITEEVAEAEFERFAEAMDFDLDKRGMDADDRKSFEDQKRRIIRAMLQGRLVIDEKGQPIFRPREGEPIIFYAPKGKALLAMDQRKEGHNNEKAFVFLAQLTQQPPIRLENLPLSEAKVCFAIVSLFSAG